MPVSAGYCYEKSLPVIDYCGDIAARQAGKSKAGYSPSFSPNNIRKLIISPDAVVSIFHVAPTGSENGTHWTGQYVKLDARQVAECGQQKGYKPIASLLHADRKCSSIEEVVVCMQSAFGGAGFPEQELNFSGIIGKNASANVESLKNSYKRLYACSQYMGTLNAFFQSVCKEAGFSLSDAKMVGTKFVTDWNIPNDLMFADMDFILNKILFNTKDWYQNYGTVAEFYQFDAAGGRLNNHFREVITDIENSRRDKAISDMKTKLSDKEKDSLLAAYDRYKAVYDEIRFLYTKCKRRESTFEMLNFGTEDILGAPQKIRVKAPEGYDKLIEKCGRTCSFKEMFVVTPAQEGESQRASRSAELLTAELNKAAARGIAVIGGAAIKTLESMGERLGSLYIKAYGWKPFVSQTLSGYFTEKTLFGNSVVSSASRISFKEELDKWKGLYRFLIVSGERKAVG